MIDIEQQVEQKKQIIKAFENVKKTKEYVERTYYNRIERADGDLIAVNEFWMDLANHLITHKSAAGFLSENFIYALKNHSEMIIALGFMDLPFEGNQFDQRKLENRMLEIMANSGNLLIFSKQMSQTTSKFREDILISQRLFDPDDRYIIKPDGRKIEKKVEQLVKQERYGCQIIVSNCTNANLDFQLLYQVPQGSIPITKLEYTKSIAISVKSFETKIHEFYFYFPEAGSFTLFPSNLSRREAVVAQVRDVRKIEVFGERTVFNCESLKDLIIKGDTEEILRYIERSNLQEWNESSWYWNYWQLKDRSFYDKMLRILKGKGLFNSVVWSYSLYHRDLLIFQELLNSDAFWQTMCKFQLEYLENGEGRTIIDKNVIYEFHPLLQNRFHRFGDKQKSNILNIDFKKTYTDFLNYLRYVPNPSPDQYLQWTYYLILQDRIEEAQQTFKKSSKIGKKMQKIQQDYIQCYLDIYFGYPNFTSAREISQQYLEYPVKSWRDLFLEIDRQLKEYDSDQIIKFDDDDDEDDDINDQQVIQAEKKQVNKNQQAAQQEEHIEFTLEGTKLIIDYQNTTNIIISFYILDLEILFSKSPFSLNEKNDLCYIIPNKRLEIKVNFQPEIRQTVVDIPEEISAQNLHITLKSKT